MTHFRTSKSYFAFQLAQLVLSIAIVVIALLSHELFRETVVLALECILILSMGFDL
jgi:hypothetical protein